MAGKVRNVGALPLDCGCSCLESLAGFELFWLRISGNVGIICGSHAERGQFVTSNQIIELNYTHEKGLLPSKSSSDIAQPFFSRSDCTSTCRSSVAARML